ncbi:MAG: hypothetical protein RLZZ598_297 [Pseudomonadota bacterium]|jgi:two-component system phosphate regulon sensor histidine kinase PhoR
MTGMEWLLPRIIAGLLALAVGAGLGYVLGSPAHAPLPSMLIGGALAVALLAIIDTLRGVRLLVWLRGSQQGVAPRDPGFWGEIAYRIERSLKASEQRASQEKTRLAQFLAAIEASPNGVLLLDAGEQIEWCNSVAADHFGLDPQRDRLQRVTNLVRAPAFVAHLQAGRYDEPVQFIGPRGDLSLSVLVRPYGEGQRLVLSQDITERERADAMRRDFVANVSHEIRTPLTVLAGFIETMEALPLTEVERQRVLGLMNQQMQRIQSLVSDLLALAQLEGSPRPAADRWVSVAGLLAQVGSDAQALSRGRHRIDVGAVDNALQIAGAEAELLSALGNLLSNAVRYTPEGGVIEIGWRLQTEGEGEFSVRDNGVGIAREHLPRLTERFYRVDSSRSRDTGGTGLGLSIVKHVAQRHGGQLVIVSEPGKGSVFSILFPASRVRFLEPAPDPRRLFRALEAAPPPAER